MRLSIVISKIFVAVIVLVLATGSSGTAGPIEDGYAAFKRSDFVEALRLLRPLAERGNASAQYYLGLAYHFDRAAFGSGQDIIWARRAAEQGNLDAEFWLGMTYRDGDGVPQDYVQAAKWFREAAERRDALCQSEIGLMYRDGQGVPQDYVQSYMGLNLATSREATHGRQEEMKGYRDEIAARMTPAQIAKGQHLASGWKPKE